jgi:hypothetical protein
MEYLDKENTTKLHKRIKELAIESKRINDGGEKNSLHNTLITKFSELIKSAEDKKKEIEKSEAERVAQEDADEAKKITEAKNKAKEELEAKYRTDLEQKIKEHLEQLRIINKMTSKEIIKEKKHKELVKNIAFTEIDNYTKEELTQMNKSKEELKENFLKLLGYDGINKSDDEYKEERRKFIKEQLDNSIRELLEKKERQKKEIDENDDILLLIPSARLPTASIPGKLPKTQAEIKAEIKAVIKKEAKERKVRQINYVLEGLFWSQDKEIEKEIRLIDRQKKDKERLAQTTAP